MKYNLILIFCGSCFIHTAMAQELNNAAIQQMETKNINTINKVSMDNQNFTTTLLVDQTPKEVFAAVTNVRGWWSEEVQGSTDKLNSEFNYQYEDLHKSKMKIIEFIPDQKVTWLVMENYFKFTKDKTEWTGTKISFEITKQGNKTQLRFTHIGLVPEYECFEICSDAWTTYIQDSLGGLITKGKGMPNGKGKPTTENEKKLSKGK